MGFHSWCMFFTHGLGLAFLRLTCGRKIAISPDAIRHTSGRNVAVGFIAAAKSPRCHSWSEVTKWLRDSSAHQVEPRTTEDENAFVVSCELFCFARCAHAYFSRTCC